MNRTRNAKKQGPTQATVLSAPPALAPAYPTYHRLAAVRAVLEPLSGLRRVSFPPRLEMVEALRRLWQSRVRSLKALGWNALAANAASGYALHCPPAAFATDNPTRRPCKLARVCPFCWGVEAELLYENLRRCVRRHPSVDLFVRSWRKRLPFAAASPGANHKRFDTASTAGPADREGDDANEADRGIPYPAPDPSAGGDLRAGLARLKEQAVVRLLPACVGTVSRWTVVPCSLDSLHNKCFKWPG